MSAIFAAVMNAFLFTSQAQDPPKFDQQLKLRLLAVFVCCMDQTYLISSHPESGVSPRLIHLEHDHIVGGPTHRRILRRDEKEEVRFCLLFVCFVPPQQPTLPQRC
jgi:hypothetical protein